MSRALTTALMMAAVAGCAGGPGGSYDLSRVSRTQRLEMSIGRARVIYGVPSVMESVRQEAVGRLVAMSEDPRPQVRANVVEALLSEPDQLKPLLGRLLRDENLGVRSVAAMVVGRGQLTEAIEDVRPLLRDPDPRVRASALYALRRCGEDADLSPLAWMLLEHPQPSVRAHAAFLLGELGDESARGMLTEAASASMPMVSEIELRVLQLQLCEALIKLGDAEQVHPVRAALYPARAEDLEAAALAAQIIGQVEDRGAVDNLINLTGFRNDAGQRLPAEVRLAAGGALTRLGYGQWAAIGQEYIGSDRPAIRAQAAQVLGGSHDVEALARLHGLMEDPEPLVCAAACAAVMELVPQLGAEVAGR